MPVQVNNPIDLISRESAGYFEVPGAHLYTVLHQVDDPAARVLLVGPFASERQNSYIPWVRWARYLAMRQIEVLRYDYRGIGESTGLFQEMTFHDWLEDLQLLGNWYQNRKPDVPMLLHGLELGALLAAKSFDAGQGHGLLLWSPPANANTVLRSTLLRWVGLEQLFQTAEERVPASAYIQQLETGTNVEVEGYVWGSDLWRESFSVEMPTTLANEDSASTAYQRPVKITKLGKNAAPLVKGGFVGYDEAKDFTWLFSPHYDWIASALALPRVQS